MPSKLIKKTRLIRPVRLLKKAASAVREKREPQVKMGKKEKEQIRRKLLDKKETIVSKLSRTVAESKEMETDIAQDLADKAESSYTKEFLLSLSDTERDLLLHLDEALRSLEKGSYGICLVCGQAISKKRLEALPWSVHCLDCQQKIETGAELESEA
ncbi:MAG TPA: TraR/DksA family transcriptional regulator [Acidobacteriota bacterium]